MAIRYERQWRSEMPNIVLLDWLKWTKFLWPTGKYAVEEVSPNVPFCARYRCTGTKKGSKTRFAHMSIVNDASSETIGSFLDRLVVVKQLRMGKL